MIPVDQQTDYDCFRAAVASVLEVPIDDVPPITSKTVAAWQAHFAAVCNWVRERSGLAMMDIVPRGHHAVPEAWCLISGPGPRGVEHCVVGYGDEVRHDPHLSRAGLPEGDKHQWEWTFFVKIDPAEHKADQMALLT